MARFPFALLCGGALALIACDDAGRQGGPPTSSPDLSAPADLGMTAPADMAQGTGPLGCKGFVSCLTSCGNSTTACVDACSLRVTEEGLAFFGEGLGCGQAFCLDDSGPPARCVADADAGTLADPKGAMSGTCNLCLTNALAAFFGATCLPTTSPDCNPSACGYTVTQCQGSTP